MSQWFNEDGLRVLFEGEQARPDNISPAIAVHFGPKSVMVVDVNYDDLPEETTDRDNDGTVDGWSGADPYIPAGSFITAAYIIVETAFAGGTSYNFGLSQLDGTVIDADGIDASVATAALAANNAVVCDGALVAGTATIGANDAYVKVAATGAFTAGKAKLVIEYIPVTV